MLANSTVSTPTRGKKADALLSLSDERRVTVASGGPLLPVASGRVVDVAMSGPNFGRPYSFVSARPVSLSSQLITLAGTMDASAEVAGPSLEHRRQGMVEIPDGSQRV